MKRIEIEWIPFYKCIYIYNKHHVIENKNKKSVSKWTSLVEKKTGVMLCYSGRSGSFVISSRDMASAV